MAKQDKSKDSLFLLEALVDKIIFAKPILSEKDFKTCVIIESPNLEPLEICDEDCGTETYKKGGSVITNFNCGKSCLFSMKDGDINSAMSKFGVKATVYKCLPCGCLPEKILIGEADIDMTKEFVQARNQFLQDPTNVSYQALKDSFRIHGADGVENGEIMMFLRLSCFGKLIVTRFQGNGSRSFGVGNRNSNTNSTTNFPCNAGGGPNAVCPQARDLYSHQPCVDNDDTCYCTGPKPSPHQPMACRNTDQYCLHIPKDCCPSGNKVVFQMPADACNTGHKQRAYFNLTSDGIGDVARDEPGQLVPTTSENYPGVVYDLPKQVIKLRVGKTIEMPGRKTKMEYQFITPIMTEEKVIPTSETRTAQCASSSRTTYQDLTEEQIKHNREVCNIDQTDESQIRSLYHVVQNKITAGNTKSMSPYSSLTSISSKASYVSTSDLSNSLEFYEHNIIPDSGAKNNFTSLGNKETTVYMTLFSNNYCLRQTSGTQATASLNKCLQVRQPFGHDSLLSCTNYISNNTPNLCRNTPNLTHDALNTDMYYCTRSTCRSNSKQKKPKLDKKGPKNENSKDGKSTSNTSSNVSDKSKKNEKKQKDKERQPLEKEKKQMEKEKKQMEKEKKQIEKEKKQKEKEKKRKEKHQRDESNSSSSSSTKSNKKKKEEKNKSKKSKKSSDDGKDKKDKKAKSSQEKGRGSSSTMKADLYATVSHIIIGPREPCPHYGREPCQGPKCIQAKNNAESEAVKVTNVTNSRRGVFELVIRKLNGAPLARNELMLEWIPPPSKPGLISNTINSLPCYFVKPCRPSRTKMTSSRKPKCNKSSSRKTCCGAKCHKKCCYKVACQPSPCPSVCRSVCNPLNPPCKSSPCLRPCLVGYRKPRRYCSQPKIRPHKKRISPCSNRAYTCPVVKCRSTPGPCFSRSCCPALPPRRCVSICRRKGCASRCNPC